MATAKCQPSKSPYHKYEFSVCREPSSFDPLFLENVNDIADTMAEIMVVCDIHRCKAKASKSIVVKAFQFYDLKRHQFDDTVSGGITKEDVIFEFQYKCLMTCVEAYLSYDIVKRAVKAFYNDTPDYSIRSPVTEAVILKEHEFAWQHAARKTIRLFDQYENLFFHAQPNYSQQITKIYNELFKRITSRADPVIVEDYHPRGCVKKVIIGTKSPPKFESEKQVCVEKCSKVEELKKYIQDLPEKCFPIKDDKATAQLCNLVFNTRKFPEPIEAKRGIKKFKKKKPKNFDLNLPRCYQCNCPKVMCDCDIEPDTGIVAIDCSQGPFECQWYRTDKHEKPDPFITKKQHQCPVDCPPTDSSSEECDYCECSKRSESEESTESQEQEEIIDFEVSDNEETLKQLMPKDMPKRKNQHKYQTRTISKLPNGCSRKGIN